VANRGCFVKSAKLLLYKGLSIVCDYDIIDKEMFMYPL